MNWLIAVYGHIGAGKTYTTNEIKEYAKSFDLDIKVFNCDKIANHILKTDDILKCNLDMFGLNINHLTPEIVFTPEWQTYIQPVLNKLIYEEVKRLHTDKIAIIEFALIPHEFIPHIEYAFFVDTPVEVRKQRVLERGKTEEYFNTINEFQTSKIQHIRRTTHSIEKIFSTIRSQLNNGNG